MQVAFPEEGAADENARQDVALLKLHIAFGDKLLAEGQRIDFAKSVLASENAAVWSEDNRLGLQALICLQVERCMTVLGCLLLSRHARFRQQ